ncbi:hypothetical protein LMIY3S_04598 [Labrys miyagiensis]
MIRPLTLAIVLSLAAGHAFAQTPPAPSVPAALDSPAPPAAKPRGVTLAQFQARREKTYMAADSDGDGKISLAEWTAFQAKRQAKGDPVKQFARMDSNHDGFIDRDELDAFFAKRFARLDKNHDGLVTRDELPGHKSAPKQGQ